MTTKTEGVDMGCAKFVQKYQLPILFVGMLVLVDIIISLLALIKG